ncbi:multidrug efflux system subunit MdtC [Caulifigura coniformis]|uniref:Multidrug efflux system subunit MdtC n=1 Tax=Caulifigura coniformis TaxID=2527983 RepID=A0A517SDS4_9PLAN|nr:MMPL family transporter [Caulifigura coniformis]QDT54276.1 multidrug efflux system subunit MdtC [Caulifigura coniformis]
MSRFFDRFIVWTVDHRLLVTLFILAMSGLAAVGYVSPESVRTWFQPTSAAPEARTRSSARATREAPPNVEPISLSNSDAVLVVRSDSDQLFTPAGARALRQIVADLESLDYVRSILWMDEIPVLNIFGLQEPLFPRAEASERRFAAARENALAHPLIGGQLLSDDGRTLLLLVKFDWLFLQSDDDCTSGLRQVAESTAAKHPGLDLSFQVTGRAPITLTLLRTHRENQARYQIIGYSVVVLMAIVLFRGIRAVLIVSLAPCVGVFWSLGFLRFFDLQDNPFNDVLLPVMLSLVGLTDGVHLMVEIRRQSAAGLNGREAARTALRKVGFACLLTSLTTAIGFGSLILAHHEVVQEFGWSSMLGVILMFLAVITVIPLACSTWLGRGVHIGHERGLIDRNLLHIGGIIDFVLARAKGISGLAIVITALLTGVSLTLRPDERMANSLPGRSEASIAMQHIDQAFGGLEFSSVQIHWSDAVPADSPEVLIAVTKVDDLLRGESLIGHPLSIRNLLDALPGEGEPEERMSMLELLPPPLKRAFYTPENRAATVSFRVQDLGIARYGPVFERIEDGLRQIAAAHPGFTFDLTGSAVSRWRNLFQIVMDLASSLGSAAVIIFCTLGLAYRSLRLGLISIIPNVFPLAVTGTFLVLAGQSLEIVSVCAFTVCLGIAVDDTIHFLTRFQEERPHAASDHDAIRRAFIGAGTGMIMTTLVLVAGFLTVIFSDMREQRVFAIMGALTLIAALIGDLLLLPALLLRYAPSRGDRTRSPL